jgi:hypothetical protein
MSISRPGWLILVLLAGVSGCASDDAGQEPGGVEGPAELPELAPPEQGFQVRSRGMTIAPGEDVEYCEIVTIPGTPDQEYWVEGFDIEMTDFSHHLIVSSLNPGSAAEAQLGDGHVEPCFGAHDIASFAEVSDVTGSQRPSFTFEYPEGVGKVFTGGQKLVFDYHYLNSSTLPVPAGHAVNFRTTSPENIQRIGRRLAFVNLTIDVPAQEQASFTGECKFDQDVMVGAVVRHTHKWGTDFTTWYAGGERDARHIWTSTDYELDTMHTFDEPVLMPAGTGFRFECAFDNTTSTPLVFGPKASDEMCILFGLWWKVGDDDPEAPQFCIMQNIDQDGVARGDKTLPDSFGADSG